MQLKPGTKIQSGKYEIIRTLGQGGFGITYEAEQVLLRRKFALKEFFMKDCCERDEATSLVTVGTGSQRALVEKFRGKFIREAQMMAGFDHPNIVRVTDVFEENGTAYYVMENLPGGSLADKVKKEGPLSEVQAEKYIRQVADALAYIHSQNTVHLDVKPSNVLLNVKGDAVLIDFGISKHYDDSGEQTSSTPVGISKGYAPLEQSRDGDVSQFKPSTDIYSLGATLYYLLSGKTPPEATLVAEEGLPHPDGVPNRLWKAIEQAMRPFRKNRPQTVAAFLALLDAPADSDETVVPPEPKHEPKKPESKPIQKPIGTVSNSEKKKSKVWLWVLLAFAVVAAIITAIMLGGWKEKSGVDDPTTPVSTVIAPTIEQTLSPAQKPETKPEPVVPGSVKVSSTPSGATIWLDGKKTKKTTPEIIEDLTPGKHSVKLVLEGYNDYSGSVTIASGKRAELSQTLKEKEKPVAVETSSPIEKPTPVEMLVTNVNNTRNSANSSTSSITASSASSSLGASRTIYSKEATIKVGERVYAQLSEGKVDRWEIKAEASQYLHENMDASLTAVKPGNTSIWGYINTVPKLFKFTIVGSETNVPENRAPYRVTSKEFTMYVGDQVTARLSEGDITRWEIEDFRKDYVKANGSVLTAKKAGTCSIWGYIENSSKGYIESTPKLFKITIINR